MTATSVSLPLASGWRRWRRALLRPGTIAGLALTLVFIVVAIASATGLLQDPIAQDVGSRLQAPSAAHWAGTDQFGRDVFARVAAGIANSLQVSVVADRARRHHRHARRASRPATSAAGPTVPCAASPTSCSRSRPFFLRSALASVLERNWFTVAIAIALVYVPLFVRVARAPVLSLREVEFVAAARATGMGSIGIILRHILPNITSVLIVQATLALNWAILTEAALSFLGFGTPPPAPSLGVMIAEARSIFTIAPWILIGPGAAIVLLVAGLNLLGDSLQSALDPRRRGNK